MLSTRSENKQKFFQQHAEKKVLPYQLLPQDFDKVVAHYKEKFGINIIVSGQTSLGQSIIIAKLQAINKIYDGSMKYVKYFKEHLAGKKCVYPRSTFQKRHDFIFRNSLFCNDISEIDNCLNEYFLHESCGFGSYRLVKDLMPDEVHKFNEICSKLSFKNKLDEAIVEWDSMKYYLYFIKHAFNCTDGEYDNLFLGDKQIITALSEFIDFITLREETIPCRFKILLTEDDARKFNHICSELSCVEELDRAIKESNADEIKTQLANIKLTDEQAIEEIREIQKNLNSGEVVGYIYNSGLSNTPNHIESLVITNTKLINLNNFPLNPLRTEDMFFPQLSLFVKRIEGPRYTDNEAGNRFPNVPQAGMVECGTLGVLHLKELLKNNATQLGESTLQFSFYNEDELSYFFFPSPELLRYSQVSAYNNILAAMLILDRDKMKIDVGHGDKKRCLLVTTLQSILLESIAAAKANANAALAIENQKILEDLPNFSKRWLMNYHESQKKRADMQGDKNYYLLYRTKKMEKIINEQKKAIPRP